MKFALLSFILLLPGHISAQDAIPGFDIFLARIAEPQAQPVNITATPGYENQPAFSPDGSRLYFTRMQADEQTDIWAYNLVDGTQLQLTQTAESEYSPTPIPGSNALSTVRVEADQKQRLWRLDLDDGSEELLLPDIEPVGYHAWLGNDSVALFLLPEPFSLMISDSNGESRLVAEHIGRSLHLNPASGDLLYVDQSDTPWRIMALELAAGEHTALAELFPAQEDFTVSSSGTLWTGLDSKLYKKVAGSDDWQLVADFSEFGVTGITRIAVSADEKLVALVAAE